MAERGKRAGSKAYNNCHHRDRGAAPHTVLDLQMAETTLNRSLVGAVAICGPRLQMSAREPEFIPESITPSIRRQLKVRLIKEERKDQLLAYKRMVRMEPSRLLGCIVFESMAQVQLQSTCYVPKIAQLKSLQISTTLYMADSLAHNRRRLGYGVTRRCFIFVVPCAPYYVTETVSFILD